MPKLVQLLALAAVVAIAASTPVSHLLKDDQVDMALEDLEVLADALEKETSPSLSVPVQPVKDDPGCCPRGKYGPSSSHCTSCRTMLQSFGSKYSNGECRNTKKTDCYFNIMPSASSDGVDFCQRGQYGRNSNNCQDCDADQTSDVGYNTEKSNCFKCDTINPCLALSGRECKPKCPIATVPGKPDCSQSSTKDKDRKTVAPGVCYKK